MKLVQVIIQREDDCDNESPANQNIPKVIILQLTSSFLLNTKFAR